MGWYRAPQTTLLASIFACMYDVANFFIFFILPILCRPLEEYKRT